MSSVEGVPDRPAKTHGAWHGRALGSYLGRMNLRALMDVVFVGAALALLLMWLALAITGGRLT